MDADSLHFNLPMAFGGISTAVLCTLWITRQLYDLRLTMLDHFAKFEEKIEGKYLSKSSGEILARDIAEVKTAQEKLAAQVRDIETELHRQS